MLHLHPLTGPGTTDEGSELTFHTEGEEPGDYLLFVLVRVDGYQQGVAALPARRPAGVHLEVAERFLLDAGPPGRYPDGDGVR